MKRKRDVPDHDPLDREIDFTNGRPNPYWLGMVDRNRVRIIDPDLVESFPDDAAVNTALRKIAGNAVARRRAKR